MPVSIYGTSVAICKRLERSSEEAQLSKLKQEEAKKHQEKMFYDVQGGNVEIPAYT